MGLRLINLAGWLLMPVPAAISLFTAVVILLAFTRSRRLPACLAASGVLFLFVLSVPGVSRNALFRLESAHPLLSGPLPEAEFIVVLGGGVLFEDGRPAGMRLGESSLYRITEGLRLARELPGAKLVVSGFCTAAVMADFAEEMGIEPGRIVVNDAPRNTYEEALEAAKVIGPGETAILVTSASHMLRAVALFRGRGLSVVPSPTGHKANPAVPGGCLFTLMPRADNIMFAETVLRERMGLAWAALRGWTG